jgi:nucleotide-binding universal stress UspA family protein
MVIVAAIDSSERASKVVTQANELAEKYGDSVHIVHVMRKSEVIQSKESDIGAEETTDMDAMRTAASEVGLKMLDGRPTTVETEVNGLIGNPADEIVRYVDEQKARYVVVSPKRQSQTGKILFGSVAQSILLNASCPVVSITHS